MSIIDPSQLQLPDFNTDAFVLEISNLFLHSQVEPATWVKQLTGSIRSATILRDISLSVSAGQMMAILGSKGSGKKALLDVIACRCRHTVGSIPVSGPGGKPGRGYSNISLNGIPMTRRLFQTTSSYMTGYTADSTLIPGLTVIQTLHYEACLSLNLGGSLMKLRLKQIMADVALTQCANVLIQDLNASEKRRLSIALAIVKDPVLLLLDEPAWGLDPLNTYFIISILSNFTKKYNRITMITMEKPRSDIFPFLDRVTYLCLGDIVYTGSTRLMLDYFRSIGFPCPEVENPLCYFLCLSTMDRRTHEKFLESSAQIQLLVEKFKNYYYHQEASGSHGIRSGSKSNLSMKGHQQHPFIVMGSEHDYHAMQSHHSVISHEPGAPPLLHAYGSPNAIKRMATIILRQYSSIFTFTPRGGYTLFNHLGYLPFMFFLLWIFYFGAKTTTQAVYITGNTLLLNILCITYAVANWSTILTFPVRRFYQERRDGLYSGPLFLLSHTFALLPFVLLTCAAAAAISYQCTYSIQNPIPGSLDEDNVSQMSHVQAYFMQFTCIAMCYLLAQQQTLPLLIVVKSRLRTLALVTLLNGLAIAVASGTLRSLRSLPEWLYYLSYVTQPRYTGAFLNEQMFRSVDLRMSNELSNGVRSQCSARDFGPGCRYMNGTHYLHDRYDQDDLDLYLNWGVSFAFPLGLLIVNCFLYALPLPALVKNKFRE